MPTRKVSKVRALARSVRQKRRRDTIVSKLFGKEVPEAHVVIQDTSGKGFAHDDLPEYAERNLMSFPDGDPVDPRALRMLVMNPRASPFREQVVKDYAKWSLRGYVEHLASEFGWVVIDWPTPPCQFAVFPAATGFSSGHRRKYHGSHASSFRGLLALGGIWPQVSAMTSTYDNAAKWSQYVDVGLLCTNAACAFQGWFTNMVVMALETDKMFEDASPLAWSDKLVLSHCILF